MDEVARTWDAQLVLEIVLVLLSAFSGTSLAFLFERLREKKRDTERDYLALREAHFSLLQQLNQLVMLERSYLEIEEDRETQWLKLKPLLGGWEVPMVKVDSLTFILKSEVPELLNRLLLAEQRFVQVRDLVVRRNELHRILQGKVQELEEKGVLRPPAVDVQTIENEVGRTLCRELQVLTDGLYGSWKSSRDTLAEALGLIEQYSRETFPKHRPPKYELLGSQE